MLGATHFHEIFESGFLHPRPSLAFGRMEVRVDRYAMEVEHQITYLYKYEIRRIDWPATDYSTSLRPGRSATSFGCLYGSHFLAFGKDAANMLQLRYCERYRQERRRKSRRSLPFERERRGLGDCMCKLVREGGGRPQGCGMGPLVSEIPWLRKIRKRLLAHFSLMMLGT